jgi:hypothetical protein
VGGLVIFLFGQGCQLEKGLFGPPEQRKGAFLFFLSLPARLFFRFRHAIGLFHGIIVLQPLSLRNGSGLAA